MLSLMRERFKMLSLLNARQRRSSYWLLLLMFIGMLLEMLGISLVVPVIMLLVQTDPLVNLPASFDNLKQTLEALPHNKLVAITLALLVTAYALKSTFLSYLSWRRAKFAFGLQAEFADRLFSIYISQPYTFHLKHNSAQLIRNASSELTIWTGNVVMPSLQLLAESMVIIGLCALLLTVEPIGTLLVVSILSVLVGTFHWLMRQRISTWGKQRQHYEGLRIQHLQQSLGSIKEVKLMGRETDFINQFKTNVYASAHASQKQSALLQIPGLWLEFFGVIGLVALVITMLKFGHAPEDVLPTLGLFAAAAFRLMPSANRVLAALQLLRFGLPVGKTLYNELTLPTSSVNQNTITELLTFADSIKIDNVDFSYEQTSTSAINGISLHIKRGESIGLVGASGSGKSTLIDLLLGLIKPKAGIISVDNHNIHDHLRAWQNLIGYVPQTIYLTDDSIKRNIALGIPESEIDDLAIQAAINSAQLENWIATLPEGINSVVGEQGVRLSGGQRQRIGIARALYHDPELLVLDEATSALDSATETEVMNAVAALHGTKTVIMVAHRTSTLSQCDRIYKLESGAITDTFLPAELSNQ